MKKSKAHKDEPKPKQESSKGKSETPGYPHQSEIIELRKRLNLLWYEVCFLNTLRAAMNPGNTICWRTEETLAEEMACSRRTVERARQHLEVLKIIEVTKVKGKQKYGRASLPHNIYRLLSPWDADKLIEQTEENGVSLSKAGSRSLSHTGSLICQRGNGSKKSVNQSRKNRTDDDLPLTSKPKPKEISRQNQDGPSSLPPISSDREGSVGEFDFQDFSNMVKAAKERGDFKPRRPAPWEQEQLVPMFKKTKARYWNPKIIMHNEKGVKWLFDEGVIAGLGEPYGLVLKSLEQIEEDRKEEERRTIELHRKWEEEHRRRKEEEKRKEKEKQLIERISKETGLLNYLFYARVYPGEGKIKPHIKDAKLALCTIKKKYKATSWEALVSACKEESRIIESELYCG